MPRKNYIKESLSEGVRYMLVNATFNSSLNKLRSNGYEIVSLPQIAFLRTKESGRGELSRSDSLVKEGIICFPNDKPRLVRISPIIFHPKEAVSAHKDFKEFYPIREHLDNSLNNSVELPRTTFRIQTNRFGENEITAFAFGSEENARNYGNVLRGNGIEKMPFVIGGLYDYKDQRPYARQLLIYSLRTNSEISVGTTELHRANPVIGI